MQHKGFTLWFTGLSGAGKSTIAERIYHRLKTEGARVELLDGDIVRTHLSKGLGFSKEDRDTNVRRIGFVSELLSRNGVIALVAAISPYRDVREEVRGRIGNFVEVYVHCPIEVLAERDVKGLYKKALAGEIGSFTGVSDPYEAPANPEVAVDSSQETIEASVERVWAQLRDHGADRMIDLHTHTNESDGTYTPAELVNSAAALRLDALAITDHDTLAGYQQAKPLAEQAGLRLVCGIELSTKVQKPVPKTVHLLGYFVSSAPRTEFMDWLESCGQPVGTATGGSRRNCNPWAYR